MYCSQNRNIRKIFLSICKTVNLYQKGLSCWRQGLGLSLEDVHHERCRVQLSPTSLLVLVMKNDSCLQCQNTFTSMLSFMVNWKKTAPLRAAFCCFFLPFCTQLLAIQLLGAGLAPLPWALGSTWGFASSMCQTMRNRKKVLLPLRYDIC